MSFTLSHPEEVQSYTEHCPEITGATTIFVGVVRIYIVIVMVWMGYPIVEAIKSACGM